VGRGNLGAWGVREKKFGWGLAMEVWDAIITVIIIKFTTTW